VRALLTELGYCGQNTSKQDRDPRKTSPILDDLAASWSFLRAEGF